MVRKLERAAEYFTPEKQPHALRRTVIDRGRRGLRRRCGPWGLVRKAEPITNAAIEAANPATAAADFSLVFEVFAAVILNSLRGDRLPNVER